jgi:hypothetical protein
MFSATTIRTGNPNALALRTMAHTAQQASREWTMQQWAGRLAARAGHRDYVGQLRELYNGILERWRYVKEPGERVPGSSRAVLGHVLGAAYNATDPTRVDVERTPWPNKGWGDCDDVSTLVAAGVLALGMTPYFRVIPGHVSVIAETPRGERVSLDPVGHPEHPFGWAAPSDREQLVPVNGGNTMYMHGIEDKPEAWHYTAARPDDGRGARVLAVPGWAKRYFDLGLAVEGCPAVDQYGQAYYYDGGVDLFVPAGQRPMCMTPMGAVPRRMSRRKGPRVRQRRRVGRVLRRVVQRVGRIGRKIGDAAGALARSPMFQQLASQGMQALGVPAPVTRGALAAGGAFERSGGVRQLAKLAKRDPSAALSMAAQAVAAGAQGAGGRLPFGCIGMGCIEMQQMGAVYHGAPVLAFVGVDGVYAFGQLDIASYPTPGRYYRMKGGEGLLEVAGKAYNVKAGTSARLERSQWINNAQVNRVYWVKPQKEFNKQHYPDGIIHATARWASDPEAALRGEAGNSNPLIYIPITAGDEPPSAPPPGPEEPELPSVVDPVEPAPPAVLPPTDEPVVPEPVTPLPPVPPVGPQQPATPSEPVVPEPVPGFDPYAPTPGMLIDTPTLPPYTPGTPEPVDPGKYQIPTCPPGLAFNYQTNQCEEVMPTACPPGQYYDFQQQQCWPIPGQPPVLPPPPPPAQPQQPQQPQQPVGPQQPGQQGQLPFPLLLALGLLFT